MLYLDNGCLLKLYYPEWNSAAVAELVASDAICLTPFHELEITSACELKVFRGEARPDQISASRAALEEDVAAEKLVRVPVDWERVFKRAGELSLEHAAATGCRVLDTLHVAAAVVLHLPLVTTDRMQKALAIRAGVLTTQV